jgi:ornithine decarboxylase
MSKEKSLPGAVQERTALPVQDDRIQRQIQKSAQVRKPAQARQETRDPKTSVTLDQAVARMRPSRPLYALWPQQIERTARRFQAAFPGRTLYAVKSNPHKGVLRHLWKAGLRAFDVASIEEVRAVRRALPDAELFFMHPVKSAEAIREAYHIHGVRNFVLDTEEELYKIVRETDLAADLTLFVRVALPKTDKASIDLSRKFGADPETAVELLKRSRPVAATLGLCFHVGSQMTDKSVYGFAVAVAADVIRASEVTVDCLDIGGGFPVPYAGEVVPSIEACIETAMEVIEKEGLDHMQLLCEPGRAMVAEAGALVVRVEQRRGDLLYLNDGTYGGLFDGGALLKTRFPVRAVRPGARLSRDQAEFRFAGPTCDSLDMMEGPFALPADIATGDYIVVGNTGAYSATLRTDFNGFGKADLLLLKGVAAEGNEQLFVA